MTGMPRSRASVASLMAALVGKEKVGCVWFELWEVGCVGVDTNDRHSQRVAPVQVEKGDAVQQAGVNLLLLHVCIMVD